MYVLLLQDPFIVSILSPSHTGTQAAIALDQSELEWAITEKRMGLPGATYDDLLTAMLDVYRNGGNSRPYAVLTLGSPLETSFVQGTPVVLMQEEENPVHGELLVTAEADATRLKVLYTAKDPDLTCRVGFLMRPSTDHCFPAAGTIHIGVESDTDDNDGSYYYEYEYLPSDDNLSDRTIQSFSTDQQIHHVLGHQSNPLHASMATFQEYYGVVDYADRIVEAALTKNNAGFDRGNLDFTEMDEDDLAGAGT